MENNPLQTLEHTYLEPQKEVLLYQRFNTLIAPLFKTLTNMEFDPSLEQLYPKEIQEFLGTARKLFDANTKLTNTEENNDPLRLVDYSEKAIAIVGDTKNIKEKFMVDGAYIGRFNKALTIKGEKRPGWIFSKKHRERLQEIVNQYNGENTPFATNDEITQTPLAETKPQKNLF